MNRGNRRFCFRSQNNYVYANTPDPPPQTSHPAFLHQVCLNVSINKYERIRYRSGEGFHAVAVYRKSKESCNAALLIKDQAEGNKKGIELASVPIKRFLLLLSPFLWRNCECLSQHRCRIWFCWRFGKRRKKKKVQAGFCDMQTFVPFEF